MEEFNKDTKSFCRLCLAITNNENFERIDVIKGFLEVLQLKLIEQENDTVIICDACFMKLFAAFDFKAVCTNTEDCIISYIDSGSGAPIDLREIYLKEIGNEHLRDIVEAERICRLCMQLASAGACELTSVEKMNIDLLRTFIPEVNLNFTEEPVVCSVCLDSLNTHTRFLEGCANVEQKIKDIPDYEVSEIPFSIGTQKTEIKSKESSSDTSVSLKEEPLGHTSERQSELDVTPKIDFCSVQVYKCECCNYKTVRKDFFTRHQLKHKDIPEGHVYKCGYCDYKTIQEYSLVRHRRRHKNISKRQMYKCDWCEYETARKEYLTRHKRSHGFLPNNPMYKCVLCSYKTTYKDSLVQHQLKHADISEEQEKHELRNVNLPKEQIYTAGQQNFAQQPRRETLLKGKSINVVRVTIKSIKKVS